MVRVMVMVRIRVLPVGRTRTRTRALPRQKREFCEISTSKGRERQTFDDPAKGSEGAILGMGANAVVHRVQLHKVKEPADEEGSARPTKQQRLSCRALSSEAVGSGLML